MGRVHLIKCVAIACVVCEQADRGFGEVDCVQVSDVDWYLNSWFLEQGLLSPLKVWISYPAYMKQGQRNSSRPLPHMMQFMKGF